jgi:hypothetical protein
MSKKMMIAVMAGTISLLAAHLASARGGGGHGGLHAMPGAVVGATAPSGAVARSSTGAADTSSGNRAQTARPNTNVVPLGNTVSSPTISSPTTPSNVGAPPARVGGASPSSANGGGLNNLAINPNGTGVSGTGASHPLAGTNTAGTALSSGLPTGESAPNRRTDEDRILDREAAKIDHIVKSICAGC